jgi:hypothetical protein
MAISFFNPLVIQFTAVTQGVQQTYTVTRPLKVVDASAYVTTAAAVATSAQISSAAGDIVPAASFSLGNNTIKQVGRAAKLNAANAVLATGAVLTATQGGAGTVSTITVTCVDNF